MEDFSSDRKIVDLKRFADMAVEGGWLDDLDTARTSTFSRNMVAKAKAE